MESKKCNKCNTIKELKFFSKNSTKKSGYQNVCKECHNKYRKKHYENNKQDYFDSAKNRKQRLVKMIADIKAKSKCLKCGEGRYWVLDFHHREDKEFELSLVYRLGLSETKILEEIDKCDVLCANCHRDFHYQQTLVKQVV